MPRSCSQTYLARKTIACKPSNDCANQRQHDEESQPRHDYDILTSIATASTNVTPINMVSAYDRTKPF